MKNKVKNQDVLVKILKFGIYLAAFTPLVIFRDFISPFHFGKVVVFRSLIEVMAVFYLVLILRDKNYLPKIRPLVVSFSLLVAFFGLTVTTSISPYLSFWGSLERMGGFWTFVHYFVFYIILVSVLTSREDWLKFLKLSIFAGFLSALYGFGQKTNLDFFLGSGGRERIFGTVGNAALFSGYQLVVLFIALTLLFSNWIPPKQKKYIGAAAFINVIAILMTVVRGSILGMGAGIFLFFVLYALISKSPVYKKTALALLMLIIVFVIFSFAFRDIGLVQNSSFLRRVTDFSLQSPTVQTRIWAWQAGFKGWLGGGLKTIILGWGPENFNTPFSLNFNPRFYVGSGSETFFDRAHNMFVEILVTMGIFALIAYVSLFVVAYKSLWNLVKQKSEFSVIGIGMTSLVTAYIVHNFFFFDTSPNFIIFLTVLGFITFLDSTQKAGINHTNKSEEIFHLGKSRRISAGLRSLMIILLIAVSFLIYRTNVLPAKANYATTRAIVKGWEGDVNGALKKFQESLNYNVPGKYEYRHRYALWVLENLGKGEIDKRSQAAIEFAIKEVQKNADKSRSDYLPYLYLSRLNIVLGKNDSDSPYNDIALKYSTKALEISPTFIRTYYEVAQAYLNKNDYESAIEIFQKAVDLNPRVGISRWYLGIAYSQAGNLEKGLEEINKSSQGEYRYRLSEQDILRMVSYLVKLNAYDEIVKAYETLIERNPKNPQYHASLATAYAQIGQIEKAIAAARSAAELDNSFESDARKFIKSLGREF